MEHVRTLRDRFTKATLNDVEHWPTEHKISGKARFIDSETIEVMVNNTNQKLYSGGWFPLLIMIKNETRIR